MGDIKQRTLVFGVGDACFCALCVCVSAGRRVGSIVINVKIKKYNKKRGRDKIGVIG